MSLVFNGVYSVVNGGGGGGPTTSDAILTVSVPHGSDITMTKVGAPTLRPTMWVQAADNTLDYALFVIGPSLFDAVNEWTVTASLSGDTASDTIIIDSAKQYALELTYNLVLIKNGYIIGTNVFPNNLRSGRTATFTEQDPPQYVKITGLGQEGPATGLIDLTRYSTIRFDGYRYAASGAAVGAFNQVNINANPTPSTYASAYTLIDDETGTHLKTVDISALSGSYYIGIYIPYSAGRNTVYVSNLLLE